jgi:hypothetical protein
MNSITPTSPGGLALLLIICLTVRVESADDNRDATRPIAQRVEDLLSRMTLEEKIGQMNMPCVYESGLGETIVQKTEAVHRKGKRGQPIYSFVSGLTLARTFRQSRSCRVSCGLNIRGQCITS